MGGFFAKLVLVASSSSSCGTRSAGLSDPFQPLPTKDVEDRLNFGTIAGNGAAMQTLNRLVGELYNPLIAANQFGFKKKMGPDQVESLEGATSSFCVTLEKVRAHAHARDGGSTRPCEIGC